MKDLIEKVRHKKIEDVEQCVSKDHAIGYNSALNEVMKMIREDCDNSIDFETKAFQSILDEYHDPYQYVAILVDDQILTIDDYLEDGVRRGGGYFVVENQGVKAGKEQPAIYKFIDRFEGSKRIARLLTQEEYDSILLDISKRKMLSKLKNRG